METLKELTDKEKRVAEYHVAHPDERRAECIQQIYRNAKRKTAREMASKLWKREEFKEYVADMQLAATAIKKATSKHDRIFDALMNPRSALAIQELATHLEAIDNMLESGRTPDLVIEGTGKGFTEARQIERDMTNAERLALHKTAIGTYNSAAKLVIEDNKPKNTIVFNTVADMSQVKGVSDDDILAELNADDSADN